MQSPQQRLLALALSVIQLHSADALEFAKPFGSFMVLPHDRKVPVHGTAEPGSQVTVEFGALRATTRCDARGRWRATLPLGGPTAEGKDLIARSGDTRVTLEDVIVGEVWLCSGQSNMDFPLSSATGGKQEAAGAAAFPAIRLCNLTGAPTDTRAYDAKTLARMNADAHFHGDWEKAAPAAAARISAIAWWTCREIHQRKAVPVGIVENAVGGSGAEAWLPLDMLESRPEYRSLLGDGWLDSPRISRWARGRARQNLGTHVQSMHPFRPGFLFESGVRMWSGFPFHGVLWYQGETNAELDDPSWNERLIVDLVNGWRTSLGNPKLPFYMVQLPRIGGDDPLRSHWPEFRETQARAVKRLNDTHLIVTHDLGWDSPDVHPPDKRPIARRLAAAILGERPPSPAANEAEHSTPPSRW